MKSEPDTLESQVSHLTSVRLNDVWAIMWLAQNAHPQTRREASACCSSPFASAAEKAAAGRAWKRLSEEEIEAAQSFSAAESALRGCDTSDRLLTIRALENALSLKSSIYDLRGLLHSETRSMSAALRQELNVRVRSVLLSRVKDIATASSVWVDFAGSGEEKALLWKTQRFLRELLRKKKDERSRILCDLHHSMRHHPLQFKVYAAWADCLDTKGLHALHERFSKDLTDARNPPSRSGYISDKEKADKKALIDYLAKVTADLTRRIDKRRMKAVKNIHGHAALLKAFGQASKPELKDTRRHIIRKLEALWKEKLGAETVTFAKAQAIFKAMRAVYGDYARNDWLNQSWEAMRKAAGKKAAAVTMIKLAGHSGYQEDAIGHWLKFEPSFEELLEMHHAKGSFSTKPLQDALTSAADSFEQAVRAISLNWPDDDERRKAAKNLAEKVSGFEKGLIAINSMKNGDFTTRGERVPVLEEILRHVTSEILLKVVVQSLGQYPHDQEKRLLVEKAIEIIGEDAAANTTA